MSQHQILCWLYDDVLFGRRRLSVVIITLNTQQLNRSLQSHRARLFACFSLGSLQPRNKNARYWSFCKKRRKSYSLKITSCLKSRSGPQRSLRSSSCVGSTRTRKPEPPVHSRLESNACNQARNQLGTPGGEACSEKDPIFLNYVQHIFPGEKKTLDPSSYRLVCNRMFQHLHLLFSAFRKAKANSPFLWQQSNSFPRCRVAAPISECTCGFGCVEWNIVFIKRIHSLDLRKKQQKSQAREHGLQTCRRDNTHLNTDLNESLKQHELDKNGSLKRHVLEHRYAMYATATIRDIAAVFCAKSNVLVFGCYIAALSFLFFCTYIAFKLESGTAVLEVTTAKWCWLSLCCSVRTSCDAGKLGCGQLVIVRLSDDGEERLNIGTPVVLRKAFRTNTQMKFRMRPVDTWRVKAGKSGLRT